MSKILDLTGQRFGRLVVIERDKSKNRVYWRCRCDCGNIKSIRGDALTKNSPTQSCGCLQKERVKEVLSANLIGQKFGELIVLQKVERPKDRKSDGSYWLCQCSCGNTFVASGHSLTLGKTISCGCKKGRYNEKKYKNIAGQKFGRLTAIEIDKEKSDRSVRLFWKCKCDCGNYTSISSSALMSGKTQSCGCLHSKGEEKIGKILNSMLIKYKKEYSFKDLKDTQKLRFDFAIFEGNELIALIEYQGIQHYQTDKKGQYGWNDEEHLIKVQENDNKKREYCKQNNIKLIEIPYWDLDKINEKYIKEKIYGDNN